MDRLLYLCSGCNETFEEDAFNLHDCMKSGAVKVIEDWENITADEMQPHDSFQKKNVTKSKRDGWKDDDINRLLDIYIKNFKSLPFKEKLRKHLLWDRIMKDLKQYGDFSRFLVQSKLKKLKKTCRVITSGQPINYEWPYYQKVMEIFRLEAEGCQDSGDNEEVSIDPEEETESDDEENDNDKVQGLQRWTIKETRHLIQVYSKYLPQFFKKGQRRKILWNEVLGELQYDLPQRFSMYQIRAKIRNVQNTYRNIIVKKRRSNTSYWPLFKDVEELCLLEQQLSVGYYNNFIDEPVASIIDPDEEIVSKENEGKARRRTTGDLRWNHEETEELLNEYKNRLEIIHDSCPVIRQTAWKEITDNVNLVRRRKINPAQAREKINLLKTSYLNDDHDESPIIVTYIKNILDEEEKLRGEFSNKVETVETPKKKKKKVKHEENPAPNEHSIPSWYVKYQKDASRRHREKMDVYKNIIKVLENLAQQ